MVRTSSSSSSSSSTVLNMRFSTARLEPTPSRRAASRTDARRVFESRLYEGSRVVRAGREPTKAMSGSGGVGYRSKSQSVNERLIRSVRERERGSGTSKLRQRLKYKV